jgi:hypothetical protein
MSNDIPSTEDISAFLNEIRLAVRPTKIVMN